MICKIYQHGVAVRKVSQLPTLTPSQGLKKFAHEIFWNEAISILITYAENFKSKRSTQKNIPKINQHLRRKPSNPDQIEMKNTEKINT